MRLLLLAFPCLACSEVFPAPSVLLHDIPHSSQDDDYTLIPCTLPTSCDNESDGLPAQWNDGACAVGARAKRWGFDSSGKQEDYDQTDPCESQWYTCANLYWAWAGPHLMFEPQGQASGSLVVFLPGTGGHPFSYRRLCRSASKVGHRVLCMAYQSQPVATSMSNRWCDPNPPGYFSTASECNHEFHQQLLFGEVEKKYEGKSGGLWPVRRDESVVGLLEAILKGHAWGTDFLLEGGGLAWRKIIISGHSQGASHASYLSQKLRVRGVFISGPQDSWNSAKDWASWPVPESIIRRSFYHAYEECSAEAGQGRLPLGGYCQANLLPDLLSLMGFGAISEWHGTTVPDSVQNVVSYVEPKEVCNSGRAYHGSVGGDSCAPEGSEVIWEALFANMEISEDSFASRGLSRLLWAFPLAWLSSEMLAF